MQELDFSGFNSLRQIQTKNRKRKTLSDSPELFVFSTDEEDSKKMKGKIYLTTPLLDMLDLDPESRDPQFIGFNYGTGQPFISNLTGYEKNEMVKAFRVRFNDKDYEGAYIRSSRHYKKLLGDFDVETYSCEPFNGFQLPSTSFKRKEVSPQDYKEKVETEVSTVEENITNRL